MRKSKSATIHVPIEVKGFDEFKEKVDRLAELTEEASSIIEELTSKGVELEIEV